MKALTCDTAIMFGRVRRALETLPVEDEVRAWALLHIYNADSTATALIAAMGVQAASASKAAKNWVPREQNRYLRLPSRVLALVTANALIVREWTPAKGIGRELARWPAGTFTAARVQHAGWVGVRVALSSGKVAVMTGRTGRLHPRVRATIDAVIEAGQQPNS
jgi:hypothetical protein